MPDKLLRNAPLAEAIVELRWKPQATTGVEYNLLLGRLWDHLREEYPHYEQTPHASAPPEVAAAMVVPQYRFRVRENGWPLIQLGPTLFTVNQTEGYDWSGDFRDRTVRAVETFFQAHPNPGGIQPSSILLRYVNAIEFDWKTENLLDFLEQNLKTKIKLSSKLFKGLPVESFPTNLDFRPSFRCTSPRGTVHLRFASGKTQESLCIVMETMIQSAEEDVPCLPPEAKNWLESAHKIPSEWFKLLTEGDLYRSFQDD